MTDTLLQQVTEQVKNTMEALSSMRPLPTMCLQLDASHPTSTPLLSRCIEVAMCERSLNLRGMDDLVRGTMIDRLEGTPGRSSGLDRPPSKSKLQPRPRRRYLLPMYGLVSKSRSKPRGLVRKSLGGGTPLRVPQLGNTRKSQLMTAASKLHNTQKYWEFDEQNGHITAQCRELKKALHELTDKGKIDHFLKRGPRSFRKDLNLACEEPERRSAPLKLWPQ
ncbi:hypothetical protein Cgig2_015621 [Carnegiea gigantea]|uniref:Uncharacterized protein n=1 Tax=Carnegiea gigantea TaxID=171969 RepID=A0A9Q1JP80_9CARY|nr:hypothetical protein Cgig2_015621 [Carnegiea gigantea]